MAPKVTDFTGKVFGDLQIITPADSRITKHAIKRYWNTQCIHCGNEAVRSHDSILSAVGKGNQLYCKAKGCGWSQLMSSNCVDRFSEGTKNISGACISQYRKGANKRGLSFEVTAEYLQSLYENQRGLCNMTGMPISLERGRYNERNTNTASLDRIDSSVGYIEGNVQWVHKHINQIKWHFDKDYFINLCRKVVEYEDTL